ncbi:MAG TPA: hypothetical protein PLP65_07605 [Bacteroidales bacterium]|nr:hypothetical protein [Bacteroidales bacterium]
MINFFRYHTEKIVQTFVSLLRILFLTRFRVKIKKHPFANDCLILANGPSLNNLIEKHTLFMQGKELVCVNFFPNTPYYTIYKPAFHVISAPELWRSDAMPIYLNLSKELFENIAQKTTWDLTLFIPFEAKKFKTWQTPLKNNKRIHITYYNPTPIEGYFWFCKKIFDWQWGMPRPHNVLIPSLMLAIKKGFKNIYVWGADHSWLKEISVDDNNQVLVNQKHFYDENTSKPQPMNKLKGTRRLHEVLIKFVHAFKGYFDINQYAIKRGVNIFNATPHSYIDAFKRIKME